MPMRIGILIASVSRNAGGLFSAVSSLSRAVQAKGEWVEVFSRFDSYSSQDVRHWGNVPVRLYKGVGPKFFGYAKGLIIGLERMQADLVHSHGLWMYPSVVACRWARRTKGPTIISPHGMLDPWAIHHAAWKKRVAARLFENANLRMAACLHALCEPERKAFRAYGLENPVAVIPNGVDLPDLHNDQVADLPSCVNSDVSDKKRLLFLGRLHPKKGLDRLISAWCSAPLDWHLIIAGWDDGGHEKLLKAQTRYMGLEDRISFVGPKFGTEKDQLLRSVDAFVLPSLSEGLPMVVLEAWAYALPVLMTKQCNLSEGFEVGAALEIPLDEAGMSDALRAYLSMHHSALNSIGARGRKLVSERYAWKRVADQMRAVYRWAIEGGKEPDCICL